MPGHISRLGAAGFHFGSGVDMARAAAALPEGRALMGNLEPRLFLPGSGAGPAEIAEQTRALRARCTGFAGWVPSTGCDLAPASRMDCVGAFIQAAGG